MRNIYYYIFYFTYKVLKFEKNPKSRAIAASFVLSLFESFNIASIVYLFKVFSKIEQNLKIEFLLLFVTISVLNLIIFRKNNRFENIIGYFENKPPKYKITLWATNILLWSYYTFSFLFLAFAVLTDAVVGDFRIVFNYLEARFGR